ncbi:hypothetical protein BDW60DRAFT_191661 [Aspergillus nidulans var. acristatus]
MTRLTGRPPPRWGARVLNHWPLCQSAPSTPSSDSRAPDSGGRASPFSTTTSCPQLIPRTRPAWASRHRAPTCTNRIRATARTATGSAESV